MFNATVNTSISLTLHRLLPTNFLLTLSLYLSLLASFSLGDFLLGAALLSAYPQCKSRSNSPKDD